VFSIYECTTCFNIQTPYVSYTECTRVPSESLNSVTMLVVVFPVRYELILRALVSETCWRPVWRRVRMSSSPQRCESYEATKRERSAWAYNWTTLFLGGYKFKDLAHHVEVVSNLR
jgi:hypothetical protein